jgi:4-amino-4-deoxy-L-arabinose transferase-like glycosyltransferase
MSTALPARSRSTLLSILLLWIAFYASFTLVTPALLDDADSVHAEVAREMLLRHDAVTLYANGIRYLEKAPLFYWSMAACMRAAQLAGATSPASLAVAARLPLAFAMLALTLLCEAFARRLFHSARAGLYTALMLLSSFGLFLFTRITIPDAAVCLWTALALYCFWRTEELDGTPKHPAPNPVQAPHLRLYCGGFAVACALNVLTKGLIGVVFPLAIVVLYLYITRGSRRMFARLRALHPLATAEAFLLIAAPWHILAGLANPTQGHPEPLHFLHGHWIVPLPTDGNVHGWFWFYFLNEHLFRYLDLRVPHDYDTAPLWLFWGLCFVWLAPWSAFLFKAAAWAFPGFHPGQRADVFRSQLRRRDLPLPQRGRLLLLVWAAFVLLFFALSTRQEYYVLPAVPALAMLLAGWLARESFVSHRVTPSLLHGPDSPARAALRCLVVPLALGACYLLFAAYSLLHTATPAPDTDLSTLLTQNPTDYALSLGHFLDLNARALGLFRLPLALSAIVLFLGPLTAFVLRKRAQPHASNLTLAATMFLLLIASHLALRTFAPVLSSAQLAAAIAPQLRPQDMVCIHGEYESGSTLGFYLQRPSKLGTEMQGTEIHILEGRSSNLWYGSFYPDSPPIFETPQSLAARWAGPQRIFLWQSLTDAPNQLPALPGPVYILVKSGGKEIVSNQPNR